MIPLRSIVYVSTAVSLMSEFELEALLIEARDLNLERNITGVLLYSGGNFMQCIEGNEAAVAETWQRIRDSKRHSGIIELLDVAIIGRSFGDWQMGFKRAQRSHLLALSSAQWQLQLDESTLTAEQSPGLFLLKHFWAQA